MGVMNSTATCERRSAYPVIRALLCLYTHIMRLFEKPHPFRFLDLPPEIRNLVYHHHFTLYRNPLYPKQLRKMAMLPDAILGVNRQVYEEASHSLYSGFSFVIRITDGANEQDQKKSFAGPVRKMPHILRHMTTIDIVVYWPSFDWSFPSGKSEVRDRSLMDLETSIETVCTSLAKVPKSRTIRFHFLVEGSSRSPRPLSPAKHRVLDLLRPLKAVRRANPGVVVKMPHYCSISTAELVEEQQEDHWGFDDWIKSNEDIKEAPGDSRAVEEDLRKMHDDWD